MGYGTGALRALCNRFIDIESIARLKFCIFHRQLSEWQNGEGKHKKVYRCQIGIITDIACYFNNRYREYKVQVRSTELCSDYKM